MTATSKTLVALSFILLATVSWTVTMVPLSLPEGDFWNSMRDYLRTGHVVSTFLPDTYPYIAGVVYKPFGASGILAAQALMYLAIGYCIFLFILFFTKERHVALLGAVIVCFDPDLISSICKVWDTEASCLILIAFQTLILYSWRRRSTGLLIVLGVIWGLGISVRPNMASLIFPLAYTLFISVARGRIFKLAVTALVAFCCLASMNTRSHGSFYLPSNGPYNLFAGANPRTQHALLTSYNAEPSIDTPESGLIIPHSERYEPQLNPTYSRQAVFFIKSHPGQWVWLSVVKLATLLRPDLKNHAALSPAGLLKLLTSLSVPLWLTLLFITKKLLPEDRILILTAAFYVLPFIITNADPRFRVPLDTIVLSHSVVLWARRFPRMAKTICNRKPAMTRSDAV